MARSCIIFISIYIDVPDGAAMAWFKRPFAGLNSNKRWLDAVNVTACGRDGNSENSYTASMTTTKLDKHSKVIWAEIESKMYLIKWMGVMKPFLKLFCYHNRLIVLDYLIVTNSKFTRSTKVLHNRCWNLSPSEISSPEMNDMVIFIDVIYYLKTSKIRHPCVA